MKTAAADVDDLKRKQSQVNVRMGQQLENVRRGVSEIVKDLGGQDSEVGDTGDKVISNSASSIAPLPTSFYQRVNDMTSAREHKQRIIANIRAKNNGVSPVEQSLVVEDDEDSLQTSAGMELPPFVFRRLPRLEYPIVNLEAMKDWDTQRDKVGVVEGWLDNVFSNDKIYEGVILKLREQILQLEARNNMLESNLDTAEIEIDYWRDVLKRNISPGSSIMSMGPAAVSTKPTLPAPDSGRRIAERTWKLAVSKFVGSGDQFLLLKVLFHWRIHVAREKSTARDEKN